MPIVSAQLKCKDRDGDKPKMEKTKGLCHAAAKTMSWQYLIIRSAIQHKVRMDGSPVRLSITMSTMPGAFIDLHAPIPNHPCSPISDVPILSLSVDKWMHTLDSSAASNSDDHMHFTPTPLLAHSRPAYAYPNANPLSFLLHWCPRCSF